MQSDARSDEALSSENNDKKNVISENSDFGYGTQIEKQESISTSSNEDELPTKKPVHKKPYNPKQRINNKVRPCVTMQDRKRKKIVKRRKANMYTKIFSSNFNYSHLLNKNINNMLTLFSASTYKACHIKLLQMKTYLMFSKNLLLIFS